MAIYSLSMSNVSRSAGSSSVKSYSYITGQKCRDERTGQMCNYGRRERIAATGVQLPQGAPAEWQDGAKLFNSIEKFERAKDARPAKKIIIALPREWDLPTMEAAVRQFTEEQFTAKGYAAAWGIHTDPENHNPHVHIIVANRQVDAKTGDWAKAKTRKVYALDPDGNKIPIIDPATGQQKIGAKGRKMWKRETVQANPLDQKDTLKQLREAWTQTANQRLPDFLHISDKTLEAQGIDRAPTVHEGVAAREIEKRGGTSVLCDLNRDIRGDNYALQSLREEQHTVWEQVGQLMMHKAEQTAEWFRKIVAKRANTRTFLGYIAGKLDDAATRATELRANQWDECAPYNEAAYNAPEHLKHPWLQKLFDKARALALPIFQALNPKQWDGMRARDLAQTREAVYMEDKQFCDCLDEYNDLDSQVEAQGGQREPLPEHPWQLSGTAVEPDLTPYPKQVPQWDYPPEAVDFGYGYEENPWAEPAQPTAGNEWPDYDWDAPADQWAADEPEEAEPSEPEPTVDGTEEPETRKPSVKEKFRNLVAKRAQRTMQEHESQYGLDQPDLGDMGMPQHFGRSR